jgi:hypothetical protein
MSEVWLMNTDPQPATVDKLPQPANRVGD